MKSSTFSRLAWAFVAYLLLVILFGAWVRITHSGAGCGSHWPTCHGEVIPPDPSIETIIEYTHRLTSGALGILGLGLLAGAWRVSRRVFVAACVTMAFIIFEALIGAGLVLRELVADDASVARAVVIALHLANTLFLTASAALVAWWSDRDIVFDWREERSAVILCGVGLVALVLTSMTGAVTALGDTLFPVDPTLTDGLVSRLRDDLSPANHFLVRLRIVHPVIACVGALYLLALSHWIRARDFALNVDSWAAALFALVLAQVIVGIVNVALAAPGWLQIVHLLMAQLVWIVAVIVTVAVGSRPPSDRRRV